MPENKIEYSVSKLAYAVITDTGAALTYGTPVMVPWARSIKLASVGEIFSVDADGVEAYSCDINNGYDGDLELLNVPDSLMVAVFGDTIDAKKMQTENAKTQSKRIALMFEFEGDLKNKRHVMYNVALGRPEISKTTKKSGKPEDSDASVSMKVTARPNPYNGAVKTKTTNDTLEVDYEGWYTEVYEPAV